MKTLLLGIASFALAIALSGCDGSNGSVSLGQMASGDREVLEQAQQVGDPWKARVLVAKRLESDEMLLLQGCRPFTDCTAPTETMKALAQAREQYYDHALQVLDPSAIAHLFLRPKGDKDLDRRKKLAEPVLLAAGANNTPEILHAAGMIVGSGDIMVRDTYKAVGFLAKAWALGDASAAGDAAHLLISINDTRNAYLWSLRCVAGCDRGAKFDLARLEHDLSPEAARQAQKAAADGTVVELGGAS